MNIVFSTLFIVSTIMLIATSPDSVLECMLNGAKNGVRLGFNLLAIYIIWLSILDIMTKISVDKLIHKIMRPITHRLFPNEDEKTEEFIAMNFSTNLLGMGSAATPLGIKAMERMCKGKTVAPNNAVLFAVINATSIQLIPATIIGLRSASGSTNPSDIILPSLIATTIATIVGVVLTKALCRRG